MEVPECVLRDEDTETKAPRRRKRLAAPTGLSGAFCSNVTRKPLVFWGASEELRFAARRACLLDALEGISFCEALHFDRLSEARAGIALFALCGFLQQFEA